MKVGGKILGSFMKTPFHKLTGSKKKKKSETLQILSRNQMTSFTSECNLLLLLLIGPSFSFSRTKRIAQLK